MLNRIIATLVFVALHIVYYLIFKSFLSGTSFVFTVYGCTVVTFVILDGALIKIKHKKRGSKHVQIETE